MNIKLEDTFMAFRNMDSNIAIAYILTLLDSNLDEKMEITNIAEKNNKIHFKMNGEVEDIFHIDNEV